MNCSDPRIGRVIALAACLGLGFSAGAAAQTRPFLTEEAHTGSRGRVVVEAGASFIQDEPNFQTGLLRSRWDVPVLNVVYSPSENVELDVEWVGRIIAIDDPTHGTVGDFGDVTLRSKLRFVDEYKARPALGVRFSVTLPETNEAKGLGPNTLRMLLQGLGSKTFSRISVHANAGLSIQDAPLTPHLQSDFFAYGAAISYAATEKLDVLAEVNGLIGNANPGADEKSETRLGVRYGKGRFRWDAAIRRGIADATGTWGFTAGVAWTAKEGR